MADYKSMYYYLAGRMATTLDVLEATTNALVHIAQKMKNAQKETEEMFMNSNDDEEESDEKKESEKSSKFYA